MPAFSVGASYLFIYSGILRPQHRKDIKDALTLFLCRGLRIPLSLLLSHTITYKKRDFMNRSTCMLMYRLGFWLVFTVFVNMPHVYSQELRSEIQVDFRVNSTFIDPNYSDNAQRLTQITDFLHRLLSDSTVNVLSISFCGTASPEGSYQLNRRLARGRLEALEKVVRSKVEVPDSLVKRDDSYIPWEQFASMVEESDLSHREEILMILGSKSEIVSYRSGQHIDSRILRLQTLDGGRAWRELNVRFFSKLRNACVVFVTFRKKVEPIVVEEPVVVPEEQLAEVSDTIVVPVVPAVVETDTIVAAPIVEEWQRRLRIKTNAVGLGLLMANAAAEIDLQKHWSFHLPVYYSAWDYFKSTVKFRTFAVQPELRYWLDEDNENWFFGAHFTMAYYNFAFDGEYRTQDRDGKSPALGGGLAVGYRLPVSKNKRWQVECSLGAGVYPLHYDKFRNRPDGLLVYTEKKTYWGIDQVNVSLSYAFDLKKKGGRR